jgi:hypothetical protein
MHSLNSRFKFPASLLPHDPIVSTLTVRLVSPGWGARFQE